MHRTTGRTALAKGQQRSNREQKKPKADKNKKTVAAVSVFSTPPKKGGKPGGR
jgi:hypothetical protein